MWLFAAISLAIATPCFRAWLEALFAELSIVFFTYLRLVTLGLSFVLLLALGFHGRRFLRHCRVAQQSRHLSPPHDKKEPLQHPKKGLAHVQWRRGKRRALMLRVKSTTSEIAGSGFHPPQLWTSSLFALAMLPIINSVVVGGGQQPSSHLRDLKSETVQTAFDTDATALVTLQQQLTTCKYSGGDDCLDDVTGISVLGEYRQERGYCAAFDAAYVNVTAGAALPAQYFPIGVEEAYAQGFANNLSTWSETNQEKFQTDCPVLYNETVVRLMEGDSDHSDEVFPAVEEAVYYVGSDMVRDLHAFCEADTGFMPLVGGMNKDNYSIMGSEILEYLVNSNANRSYESACYADSSSVSADVSTASTGSKIRTVVAFFGASALALGFAYSTRYGKRKRVSVLDESMNGHMGSGMLSFLNLDQLKSIGRWDDRVTQYLKHWGDFVAMGNHPLYIILISLMIVVCCSSGLMRLKVETDSMKLWVSESSTVFQEYTRFGELLGPVDRTERLVLVAKDGGAVSRSAYIKEAIRLQQVVASEVTSSNITLNNICVKDSSNSPCHVNALTQYFQNSMDHFEVYETYGLVIANYQNVDKNADAIAWERAYIARMEKEADNNEFYDIYYATETSQDDEFSAGSNLDIVFKAGIAGFILIFIYVAIGLNHWKVGSRFFHSSKVGVGFMGVACILMAVGGTFGILVWTGVKLHIVTLVMLPLLMLAIGTGNVFLILHAVDLKHEELMMEQRSLFVGLEDNDFGIHEITCVLLCEATGHIGPSMIVTATCECLASSFTLQMTLFLAIVALDKRRELSGTYDVLCCKRASFARRHRLSEDENTTMTENSSFPESASSMPDLNLMYRLVNGYVNVLLKKTTKVLVVLVFVAYSYLHSYYRAVDDNALSTKEFPVYFVVEGGYGRNPDSFNDLSNDVEAQSKLCSSKDICADLSIPNILNALVADGESNVTYFKSDVVVGSWLDDFWGFVNPDSECCRVDRKINYTYSHLLPEETNVLERASTMPSCLADTDQVLSVSTTSFMPLFSMFSTAAAGSLCTYAAGTRYHGQLSIDNQPIPPLSSSPTVTLNGTGYGNDVTAFAYKVLSTTADSSTISGSQEGTIIAYAQAQHIAKWISDETGIDVWVYSPQYVYLKQFHSIRRTAYIVVGIGLAMLFVVQSLALGSYGYGFAVTFIAAITVVQVAGLMMPMGVPLNSLSIVILSIAVTFSVGFSGHFARLFAKARTITDDCGYPAMGDTCAKKVLTQLLVSWTLGVAITKFVAIAALALVATPVFEPAGNCFFRMLMAAAVSSWLNSAVLLPVGLSISVDATEVRVRDVQPTNEEGGDYSRESPSSSYHNARLTSKY
ncbi:Patched family protein [Phytophthora megakarya]|uniref:Patched family protein n=1 Tax=Phytophthora megakarya TaxID=4795 RepID=A0A225VNA5_9STRA|nr:Patched family protein [Phytophthora megakarya]